MGERDSLLAFSNRSAFHEEASRPSQPEGGQRRQRNIFTEEHWCRFEYTGTVAATAGNLSLGDAEVTYNRVTPNERNKTDMSMYPEIMVVPMREELTRLGIEELKTPEE